jgi:hypothetical protein
LINSLLNLFFYFLFCVAFLLIIQQYKGLYTFARYLIILSESFQEIL